VADDIVTRACCDVRPCGCADARMVIDHLHAEIERLREQNATLQDAVSEEGRANRMTTLYEKALAENEQLRANAQKWRDRAFSEKYERVLRDEEIDRLREHINGLAASHPLARPYEPPTWLTAHDSWEVDRGNT